MSLQKRPWRLILLTGALAVMQFGAVLRRLTLPPELAANLSLSLPLELLATMLWALIFAAVAVNLVRRKGSRWTFWVYVGFIIYTALRLIIFAAADYDQGRRPFIMLVALVMLALLAVWRIRR